LRQRRGHNKAWIAIVNKLARIVWAIWCGEKRQPACARRRITNLCKEMLSENVLMMA
jgi:hypothetical protein